MCEGIQDAVAQDIAAVSEEATVRQVPNLLRANVLVHVDHAEGVHQSPDDLSVKKVVAGSVRVIGGGRRWRRRACWQCSGARAAHTPQVRVVVEMAVEVRAVEVAMEVAKERARLVRPPPNPDPPSPTRCCSTQRPTPRCR